MPQNRQQQNMQKLKTKLEKSKLPTVTKALNKEIKERRKTKRAISTVNKAQKKQLRSYLETIRDKVNMILQAIDEDKVKKAGLAQLAKAFRSLASEMMYAQKDSAKKIEQKSLNVNINVKEMSSEELLKFLSKKSQEHD